VKKAADARTEPIKVLKKWSSSKAIMQIGTYRIFTLRLVTRTLALPLTLMDRAGVRKVARQMRYFNAHVEQALALLLTGYCSVF
jgi:hypothetical protein